MLSRKFLVGAMVTVGGAVLAVKKLAADKDLRNDAKEKGKKLASDAEDFINSVGAVAKDTADKAINEGRKIVDEFKEAAEEAKEQLRSENEESATNEDVHNEEKENGEDVAEDVPEDIAEDVAEDVPEDIAEDVAEEVEKDMETLQAFFSN